MTETRAEAQRLVDEGGVHIMSRSEVCIEGRVGINKQGRAYHTFLYTNGRFSCNCDECRHGSLSDDLCIHALALRLAVEKEE